jgi:hypothetical protein
MTTTYWLQILEMIETADRSVCWTLPAKLHKSGYFMVRVNGVLKRAHCAVYEVCIGPIPKGLEICHKCDNKACFNPNHLIAGTHFYNMGDSAAKGRQRRILNDEQIKQMKVDRKSGMIWQDIADKYIIATSTAKQYMNY